MPHTLNLKLFFCGPEGKKAKPTKCSFTQKNSISNRNSGCKRSDSMLDSNATSTPPPCQSVRSSLYIIFALLCFFCVPLGDVTDSLGRVTAVRLLYFGVNSFTIMSGGKRH